MVVRAEDEGIALEGKIDILVFKENFWTAVVESKRLSFSLEEALAQLLAYMLADPNPAMSTFGLLANGGDFRFVKLARSGNAAETAPQYALSKKFVIDNPGNELYEVFGILKQLGALAGNLH